MKKKMSKVAKMVGMKMGVKGMPMMKKAVKKMAKKSK
jgi:hypothetical protein